MEFFRPFVVLALCCTFSLAQQRALPTVREIDFPAYLGRWYQMYANRYSYESFEKNGVCHTATYGLNTNGTISVTNKQTLFEPNGDLDIIYGYAFVPDLYDPGKLLVNLQSGFDDVAPYWVVKLGPKETQADGSLEYQYAIVTDNLSAFLFVLARDVDEFRLKYDYEVRSWLDANGFTKPFNRPVESLHTPECIYD
ncbi:apolipoprotein D-like [Glandiceps talaboti]